MYPIHPLAWFNGQLFFLLFENLHFFFNFVNLVFFSLSSRENTAITFVMSLLRSAVARSLRAASSRQTFAPSRVVAPLTLSHLSSVQPSQTIRQFHLSRPAFGSGESDAELSSRLEQEIVYEKEAATQYATENNNGEPEFLSSFKKAGIWKIEDQSGSDEIALVREFGNEHIRILFSIGDIDTSEDEETPEEDEVRPFPVRCAITISKVSRLCRGWHVPP
jgi:complement component 1 Q subcomponent-binding protein